MSERQIESLGRNLKPSLIFGRLHKKLSPSHPIVSAISGGLDYRGNLDGYIARNFVNAANQQRAVTVVKELWRARVVESWRDIMARVVTRIDEGCSSEAISRWLACLCRYLQATAIPADSPSRLTRFLLAISETVYLPLDFSQKFEVRINPLIGPYNALSSILIDLVSTGVYRSQ